MVKYFRYFRYVLKHKWFVFLQCAKQGILLRGITHDWHKFLPSEWFPYVDHFFGKKKGVKRDTTGYYKPTDTGDPAFDYAWFLHQKRADHHWQWWVLPEDESGVKLIEMSAKARLEMVCDWWGASKAQGNGEWDGVQLWYAINGHKMQLHRKTREWVEDFLYNKK